MEISSCTRSSVSVSIDSESVFWQKGGKLEDLKFKVASYPIIPIMGVLAFLAMLIVTLMDPGQAVAIYVCAPCYFAIYIISLIYTRKKGGRAANLDI